MILKINENTIKVNGVVLTQIKYIDDVYFLGEKVANKGDKGGYVQSIENIGENVWISPCSKVIGNRPLKNCKITDMSTVIDSEVTDSVIIRSKVSASKVEDTKVNDSVIKNSSVLKCIHNKDVVKYSNLNDITSNDVLYNLAKIYTAYIKNSSIHQSSFGKLHFMSNIKDSKIYDIHEAGTLQIKHGVIESHDELMIIDKIGSSRQRLQMYTDFYKNVRVSTGCFDGTETEFLKRVYALHRFRNKKHFKSYIMALKLAKVLKPSWKFKGISIWKQIIIPLKYRKYKTSHKINDALDKDKC